MPESPDATGKKDDDSPRSFKYGCHLCGTDMATGDGGSATINETFVRLCSNCEANRSP